MSHTVGSRRLLAARAIAAACAIAAAVACFGQTGSDASFVNVNAISWIPQTWPLVTVDLTIKTDFAAQCGLILDDFVVYENGLEQELVSVQCVNETGVTAAEIVFAIDTSGSMGAHIETVRLELNNYIDIIEATLPGLRMGLVEYGDADASGQPKVVFDLTNDYSAFRDWLDTVQTSGGTEPAWQAADTAMTEFSWTPTAQKAVIILTDEPSNGDIVSLENVVADAQLGGFQFHVASTDYGVPSSAGDRDPRQLAELTNGLWQDIATPDFSQFIPRVLGTLVANYRLVYRTSEPCCTNFLPREVCVTVTDPVDGEATDCSSYQPHCEDVVRIVWSGHEPYSEYPEITIGATVNRPEGYNCELTQEHFTLLEANVPQEILTFHCNPEGGNTKFDMAFIIDDSGSMTPYRQRLGEQIEVLMDGLYALRVDAQINVLAVAEQARFVAPTTNDPLTAAATIQNIPVADDDELTLDAINLAHESVRWRPAARRFYVIITDETANLSAVLMTDIVNKLQATNAVVVVVSPAGLGGTLPVGINDTDPRLIAEALGGVWMNLETYELEELLKYIGFRLIAQYVVTYRTDQVMYDSQARHIELRVAPPNACVYKAYDDYTQRPVVYVNKNRPPGIEDGRTWETAYNTLHEAMAAAASREAQIWVAQGIYDESRPHPTGALAIERNVLLYGGFQGDEILPDERDPLRYPTVIEGSVARGGLPAYHVIIGHNQSTIDGFIIRNGVANGSDLEAYGAGMLNYGVSPRIRNCIFESNAAKFGGAVYNHYSAAQFENCVFVNNNAEYGGAVRNARSNILVSHSAFLNNSGSATGSAIYQTHSTTDLTNSIAWSNGSNALVNGTNNSAFEVDSLIAEDTAHGGIVAAPEFVSVGDGNYRLLPWSPAIDAGALAKTTAKDFRGAQRPQFNAPDLGPFEFTATGPPAPVITSDGGNGPGVGFVSDSLEVVISGSASPGLWRVVGSGLVGANVVYSSQTGDWSYAGVLPAGETAVRVAAIDSAGEPSTGAEVTIGNGALRNVSILASSSVDVIETGQPWPITGTVTSIPADESGALGGKLVLLRYIDNDGNPVFQRNLSLNASGGFSDAWIPPDIGMYTVQARFLTSDRFVGTDWTDMGISVAVVTAPPPIEPSDVNGDGLVDAVDIQLVINAVLGIQVAAEVEPDVNGDGALNSIDIQLVILAVLNETGAG